MASNDDYDILRKKFVEAENYIKKNDKENFLYLANQMHDYPLTPYLYYQWLIRQMELNAEITDTEVKLFLKTNKNFPLENAFKRKWILYLDKHKKSSQVLRYYPEDNERTEILCPFIYAQYDVYANKDVLKQVKDLWLVHHSQPQSCDKVFELYEKEGMLTQALIWQRLHLALSKKRFRLAGYLLKKLEGDYQIVGKSSLLLAKNPKRLNQVKSKKHPLYKDLYTTTLTLLAWKDPELAIDILQDVKSKIKFKQSQLDQIHHALGVSLAHRHDANALKWLKLVKDKPLLLKHWQIRLSIRNQQWRQAIQYIDSLPKEERAEPQWRYWMARSFEALNQHKLSIEMYKILAKERNYYGFLAANKIGRDITLKNFPIRIKQTEINKFAKHAHIKRIAEWRKLKRTYMERIEWRHLLKDLPELQKLAAAKYAHQRGWLELGILALSKAEYKNDLPIRFPFAHKRVIQRHAKERQLNADWVFALTRQESAFYAGAVSSVGARGLMQLMPKTASYIANLNQVELRSKYSLHIPEINVKLGTLYFSHLMNQFDKHPILATASYNAGPGRIKRWMPNKNMDADVWIESMPFQETRDYVKNIITYSQIYRALEGHGNNLNDIMRPIGRNS